MRDESSLPKYICKSMLRGRSAQKAKVIRTLVLIILQMNFTFFCQSEFMKTKATVMIWNSLARLEFIPNLGAKQGCKHAEHLNAEMIQFLERLLSELLSDFGLKSDKQQVVRSFASRFRSTIQEDWNVASLSMQQRAKWQQSSKSSKFHSTFDASIPTAAPIGFESENLRDLLRESEAMIWPRASDSNGRAWFENEFKTLAGPRGKFEICSSAQSVAGPKLNRPRLLLHCVYQWRPTFASANTTRAARILDNLDCRDLVLR